MATKEILVCDGCGFEENKKAAHREPSYQITFEVDRHVQILSGEKDLCCTCYNKLMDFLDTLGETK